MRQHGGVKMTAKDALALRMRSLLLAGTSSKTLVRADSVAAVVTWFGAMQAQDYASGLWSLGARLPAMTRTEVEAAARQVATVTALVPLALADVAAANGAGRRHAHRVRQPRNRRRRCDGDQAVVDRL